MGPKFLSFLAAGLITDWCGMGWLKPSPAFKSLLHLIQLVLWHQPVNCALQQFSDDLLKDSSLIAEKYHHYYPD